MRERKERTELESEKQQSPGQTSQNWPKHENLSQNHHRKKSRAKKRTLDIIGPSVGI